MTDADFLDDLVARLFRLREQFGADAYREAVFKSAVAIARVAMAEAEGRARERSRNDNVFLFPARPRRDAEDSSA